MAKTKKRMSSLTAITLRISAALLAIWLFCMTFTTLVMAHCRRVNYTDSVFEYNEAMYRCSNDILSMWALPSTAKHLMMQAAEMSVGLPSYAFKGFNILRREGLKLQTSAIFYDSDGEEIVRAGNYLSFAWTHEHSWQMSNSDLGFINVDKIPGLEEILRSEVFTGERNMHLIPMRFTGKFDEGEFFPIKIEFDTNQAGKGGSVTSRNWITLYEAEPEAEGEYITIYANDVWPMWTRDTQSVRWGSTVYDSLGDAISGRVELFKSNDELTPLEIFASPNFNGASYDIRKVINMSARPVFLEDNDDNDETPAPVAFYMVSAAVCYPLKGSINELLYVYIYTFVATVIIALLVLRSVKRSLADPLKLVCNGIADGWGYVSAYKGEPKVWREPYEISRHYRETLDKLRADKNEIARLTTALEYAREAEEQRRQMSSNIAHELKTPLAVIRSYAEGLQEHIAEEKRDKYLEVIVGETERMDELVLEMLELSRLEAGRVKLARDVCDLSALTHSVFEKLEPAAEAKELTITYELQKDCLFSADEARILQVIGNFASNALRYTPVGGHIWVRTSMARGYVSLAVENTSPHLSDEVLSKVWERFWRAEEARSEKSSGLGLAIAKSIVELHGGKCSAENTEKGVEFAFTI